MINLTSRFLDQRSNASRCCLQLVLYCVQQLFSIRAAVEGLTDFRVCGEAKNGVEAIEKATELKPDLVVMDLAMPLMNGLEASTVLKNAMPRVPIILLTLYAEQVRAPMSTAFGVATVLSKVDGLVPLLECLDKMLSTAGSE